MQLLDMTGDNRLSEHDVPLSGNLDLSEHAGRFPEFYDYFPVHDRTISYGFTDRPGNSFRPQPIVPRPGKIYTERHGVFEQPIEESESFPPGSNNRQFACYTTRWRPRPLFKAVTTITVMLEIVRVNAKESAYESAFEIDRKVRFDSRITLYKAKNRLYC